MRNMWYEAVPSAPRVGGGAYDLFVCFAVDPEAEAELYDSLLLRTVMLDGEYLAGTLAGRPVLSQSELCRAFAETERAVEVHLLYAEASDYDGVVIFHVYLSGYDRAAVLPTLSVEIGGC